MEKINVAAIKNKVLCGDCKSAKFMIWNKKQMRESPRGAFIDIDQAVYILVRCDFFKLTVASPDALLKCEGYRSKTADI